MSINRLLRNKREIIIIIIIKTCIKGLFSINMFRGINLFICTQHHQLEK